MSSFAFDPYLHVQCGYLINAPVDQTSGRSWLKSHSWMTCKENKPSTSMIHVACESKPRLVVGSSMYPCLDTWVAIGHTVVFNARPSYAFSAGIKCRYCTARRQGHNTPKLTLVHILYFYSFNIP